MTISFNNIISKSITDSVYILFYAPAFESRAFFHDQTSAFSKKLSNYHPFNILSGDGFFSFCNLSDPVSNPASLATPNILNIGMTLNRETRRVEINTKTLSAKMEAVKINSISSEYNLKQLLIGDVQFDSQCLLVVLLPPQGEGGFENEFEPTDNDFYFVATSCDGNWEQVIIRSICKLMGLGDEFEQNGPDFEQPDKYTGKMLNNFHPNLIYLDTPLSSVPAKDTKWRMLGNKPGFDFPIRKAPSHPSKADLSLPTHNFLPSGIELWEGGGGYRTKIYRSAHDCLMRREIGNKNLPVRAAEVPLCPVCAAYMQHKILEFGRENREPSLEFRGFIQQL